jgi:hypothetical protein
MFAIYLQAIKNVFFSSFYFRAFVQNEGSVRIPAVEYKNFLLLFLLQLLLSSLVPQSLPQKTSTRKPARNPERRSQNPHLRKRVNRCSSRFPVRVKWGSGTAD